MLESPRSTNNYPLSNSQTRLVCTTCQKQFSRLEHLRRHDQVHASGRAYKCSYCEKAFARKDAATRHEDTHKSVNSTQRPIRLYQSCAACRRSRVKCSGRNPCARCAARHLQCQYLPRKTRRPFHLLANDDISDPAGNTFVDHSGLSQDDMNTVSDAMTEDMTGTSGGDTPSSISLAHAADTNVLGANWLPFENSGNDNLASLLMGEEIQYETNPDLSIPTSVDEGNSFYRYDRVSELIISMRTGLPGSSQMIGKDESCNLASLYADGAGARTSQSDRHSFERRRIHSVVGAAIDASMDSGSSWIKVLQTEIQKANEGGNDQFIIPESIYQEILATINPQRSTFSSSTQFSFLIQNESLELFIQLYFTNFHPFYPFLDRSLLSIPVWGWSLCLATAAIGARFLCIPDITIFADSLSRFLHQVLLNHTEESLPYIQARVLATIGLCHSSDSSFMSCGYNSASLIYNSCLRFHLLEEDDRIGIHEPGQDLEQVWIAWRFRETRRRTGLFIWVIDCTFAFVTQTSPRLPLKLLNLRVPCADNLWEAETSEQWLEILRKETPLYGIPEVFIHEEKSRLLVRDAVRRLWTKTRIAGPATQFGRIVLISVLVRRILDTIWYLDDPDLPSETSVRYLAAIPQFTRWRNATCDCLDTLHWEALSISASAQGTEGPIFLHLHLARLMLLTPIRQFFGHINAKRGAAAPDYVLPHELYDVPEPDLLCQQIILIWANQDRYKARLAIIHAGAIFWHVRRYSSDSFVQPFAICLAAITLWMYGKYSSFGQLSLSPSVEAGEDEAAAGGGIPSFIEGPSASTLDQNENPLTVNGRSALPPPHQRMPRFVQLDRPIDDELVQHFIRSNERMTLFMEGVLDLCSDEGPNQVLREGIVLLNELVPCWAISRHYSIYLNQFSGELA